MGEQRLYSAFLFFAIGVGLLNILVPLSEINYLTLAILISLLFAAGFILSLTVFINEVRSNTGLFLILTFGFGLATLDGGLANGRNPK
ncbi:hypothetical protein [Thermococcus sp.]